MEPPGADAAVEADRPVLALPEVVAALARRSQLLLLAQRADLVPLLEVVALPEVEAEPAVEEASAEAGCRSFSAAMAGNLASTGTPRCSPAPRSGRKAKRHR